MPPTPLDIAKADIEAYKFILGKATEKQKQGWVSSTTTEEFNALVGKIRKAVPEMAPDLPGTIPLGLGGDAQIKFLELEIMVERVLNQVVLYQKG